MLMRGEKIAPPLISIGPCSDAVLDHIGWNDSSLPRLHNLLGTVRSSRWEITLAGPEWNLRPDQSAALATALLKDVHAGNRDYTINVIKVSLSRYC